MPDLIDRKVRSWSAWLAGCSRFVMLGTLVAASSGCAQHAAQSPPTPPVAMAAARTAPASSGAEPQPQARATPWQSTRASRGVYKIGKPYQIRGRWYYPREEPHYDRSGLASWYGPGFHGKRTANGEIFNTHALTAAHPTLPLPSYVHVTSLSTGRTILVRVNDRGPYVEGRIIDLSLASAMALGYAGHGVSRVRIRWAGRAPLDGDDSREQRFLASQPWYRPGMLAQAGR